MSDHEPSQRDFSADEAVLAARIGTRSSFEALGSLMETKQQYYELLTQILKGLREYDEVTESLVYGLVAGLARDYAHAVEAQEDPQEKAQLACEVLATLQLELQEFVESYDSDVFYNPDPEEDLEKGIRYILDEGDSDISKLALERTVTDLYTHVTEDMVPWRPMSDS